MLGFLMAVFTASILKSTILKSEAVHFVMEMPPYRWPTFSSLGLRLLDRAKVFLFRAGTIILLWLSCFGGRRISRCITDSRRRLRTAMWPRSDM